MSRKIVKLSPVEVGRLKEPGLHWIRDNLYLNVTDKGTRSWIYRFMLNGRGRAMGLGSFPRVSIAAANEKVSTYAKQVDEGVDPIDARRRDQEEKRRAQTRMTFASGSERYIKKHEVAWKNPRHARIWRASLRNHVYSTFGEMGANDVKTAHVLEAIEPIWLETPSMARHVLKRVEVIFDDLIVRGDRTSANPARWKEYLEHVFPVSSLVRATRHHPWLPHERIPEFIAALRRTEHIGARPLEFLILAVMRPYEVLRARWEHIDIKARIWTAQPEDIKGRREERDDPHRVPLCDRSLEIIEEMRPFRNGPYLFPGTKETSLLRPSVMADTITLMGWSDVTAHGFRSSFDTWATNHTLYSPQAVQYALTHIVKAAQEVGVNPNVRRAYQHGDMLELRRPLMEDWAVVVLTGKTPERALRPDYTGMAA